MGIYVCVIAFLATSLTYTEEDKSVFCSDTQIRQQESVINVTGLNGLNNQLLG